MANPAVQRTRFLAPGDKLGKHDLIRQIAVGGMAELYLARTMGLEGFEKLVVLKRILPQYAGNSNFVNMFLNEARLAATLHHPNIAQVFDIDQDGADYFFSMEYVHGQDLGHLVASANESGVPLSLDAALTLVAGLCAGLHYAHEKVGPDGKPLNVVHRDVSPSNVLVSYDGAVKVVDFGIARAGSTPSTTRGGLKGKIAYMSPEQCRGKVALDRRSDVFSIGTILYELTTGRPPFTDETEYGILNQIVNRDADPPSRLVNGYSPELEAIAMRALARNPDQRYATALEMQKDIEDFAHENRLRVSPLVLARLMGTLYPTRLEEWDHARAQGAFFVEQHVVRTLIESGRGTESSAPAYSGTVPVVEDEGSGHGDTVVGPPPVEDTTNVRPSGRARSPVPLPGMPPPRVSEDTATVQVRPSSPALGAGQPPRRPSEQTIQGSPPAPERMQGMPLAASPEPVAPGPAPEPLPLPPRMATPVPGRMMTPVPVPGQPGAVPIVMPLAAPSVPEAGTLVSNRSPSGSNPALVYPLASALDVTDRVRAPAPTPAMPGETALVQIGRSRLPVILLVATAVVAAAIAAFIVLGGDKEEVDPAKPAAVSPVEPPAQQDDPAKADDPAKTDPAAKQDDPAKADDPAAKQDDPSKTADGPDSDDPAKADDPAGKDPKNGKKTKLRQPPRGKQTRVTPPKKDPKKDPEKESKPWDPNDPFLPVRPPQKK